MPKKITYYEEIVRFAKATEKKLDEVEEAQIPRGFTLRDMGSRFTRLNILKAAFNLCQKKLLGAFQDELTPNLPMEGEGEPK